MNDDDTFSPQPHNLRPSFESIQHDSDPSILIQMSNRFVAAASEVMIPEGLLVDYAEVLAAFRTDVHVAIAGEWCRCDEDHFLGADPVNYVGRDGFVEGAHGGCFCWLVASLSYGI